MHSNSLRDFVSHALEDKRIRFGDLRRLQRDILPARITTRQEAEMLIELDRAVVKADPAWREYLVVTVRDFVVWGLAPFGRVDWEKAEWLAATLLHGGPTKTGRIIAREIAHEARQIDSDLVTNQSVAAAIAAGSSGRRTTRRAPMTDLVFSGAGGQANGQNTLQ